MAKKKKSDNTAMNVGMGVAGGALVGMGLGVRRGNATKKRIPKVATKMANRNIDRFNNFNNAAISNAQFERAAIDKAYSGTTGRDESRFQKTMGNRYGEDKLANRAQAAELESSGKMTPSRNKQIISQKLRRAPKVAANRTKKYARRGAAAGGAIALLASLVAKELSKGGSKKRG